jgi:hypothetical protein
VTLALVADVGGTHSRFALASHDDAGGVELTHAHTYASGSAASIEPLLLDYLSQCGARPDVLSLAIAGPVVDGICRATNLPWIVEARAIAQALGAAGVGAEVVLLNDFEAVAWGVREVPGSLRASLLRGERDPLGPIAVLGAGTGLGEALAVPLPGGGLRVLASEGGHADLAPRDAFEDGPARLLARAVPRSRVLRARALGPRPDGAVRARDGRYGRSDPRHGAGRRRSRARDRRATRELPPLRAHRGGLRRPPRRRGWQPRPQVPAERRASSSREGSRRGCARWSNSG